MRRPFNYFTHGAAATEVELDVLTGDFQVRNPPPPPFPPDPGRRHHHHTLSLVGNVCMWAVLQTHFSPV